MSAERILFTIFSLATAGGAIMVVFSQNVVRMAFWLVVSLGSASGLFFLLNADFVAATQLLIYVGGTLVLLIFGVMLTASGPLVKIKASAGDTLMSVVIGGCLFALLAGTVSGVNWNRAALTPVEVSQEKYNEAHHWIEEEMAEAEGDYRRDLEEMHHLLHDYSHSGTGKLRFDGDELNPAEAELLLTMWVSNGLKFAPFDEAGGTARPLGFGLLGMRPDADLNAPDGMRQVAEGFYVAKPKPKLSRGPKKSELSTGYLLPFEIVSVHLLVVLIGAAYLARAKRRVDQV